MSNHADIYELDPVVVPIADSFAIGMDEWLAGLCDGEPTVLTVSTAMLLADARAESE